MSDFDFEWRTKIDKAAWPRSCALSTVLKAKQLAYDLWRSVPNPQDSVRRHEDLSDDHVRHGIAFEVASLYLVAQLDRHLASVFSQLWDRRRDMLHQWIADRLPAVEGRKKSNA